MEGKDDRILLVLRIRIEPREWRSGAIATTALDMTTLLHEIFFCQDQLDEIARRRQPLIIKKRDSPVTRPDGSNTRSYIS
jgi:hypothetical protein